MRGAEAVISRSTLLGRDAVVKERARKAYRAAELDNKLRKERTRAEAKLLHRAKLAGVPCPAVLEVSEFSLVLGFIEGEHPKMSPSECRGAGMLLARLHDAGIIHGDYTPVNLLKKQKTIYVIDFGLGFFSNDIEDMAVDVYTMLKAIPGKREHFLSGYGNQKRFATVMKRVAGVEKRVRYAT